MNNQSSQIMKLKTIAELYPNISIREIATWKDQLDPALTDGIRWTKLDIILFTIFQKKYKKDQDK
jgi:hypothetical protein